MDTEREGESSDVHRGSELEWCKPVESFRYKCLYKKVLTHILSSEGGGSSGTHNKKERAVL